jgi:hypothetical protein
VPADRIAGSPSASYSDPPRTAPDAPNASAKISSVDGGLGAARLPHDGASREHQRQSLQLTLLSRKGADRSPRITAAFFMMQKSARFPGKCTIAVQFAAASITSVFRKQSVVKDRFSSAVKPVNRKYNEGCQ